MVVLVVLAVLIVLVVFVVRVLLLRDVIRVRLADHVLYAVADRHVRPITLILEGNPLRRRPFFDDRLAVAARLQWLDAVQNRPGDLHARDRLLVRLIILAPSGLDRPSQLEYRREHHQQHHRARTNHKRLVHLLLR